MSKDNIQSIIANLNILVGDNKKSKFSINGETVSYSELQDALSGKKLKGDVKVDLDGDGIFDYQIKAKNLAKKEITLKETAINSNSINKLVDANKMKSNEETKADGENLENETLAKLRKNGADATEVGNLVRGKLDEISAKEQAAALAEQKPIIEDKKEAPPEPEKPIAPIAPESPESPQVSEAPAVPKTTTHVVQIGERIQDLVKKSLEAQGKAVDVNSEEFKKAKDEFIQNNKAIIREDKKGNKYMLAGKSVTLDGEVKFENEKSADEVDKAYRESVAKKDSGTKQPDTPATSATPATPAKPATPATPATPAKPATPAQPAAGGGTTPNLKNMAQAEIDEFTKKYNIKIQPNATFQKNTKTGEVIKKFTKNNNDYTNTYNSYGHWTQSVEQEKDGTISTYTGDNGLGGWAKKVTQEKDGTVITETNPDKYGNYQSRVVTKADAKQTGNPNTTPKTSTITQSEKDTIARDLKNYQYSKGASLNSIKPSFNKLSQDVLSQLNKKFNNNPVQVAMYISQNSGGQCRLSGGKIVSNVISNNPQEGENVLSSFIIKLAKGMIT